MDGHAVGADERHIRRTNRVGIPRENEAGLGRENVPKPVCSGVHRHRNEAPARHISVIVAGWLPHDDSSCHELSALARNRVGVEVFCSLLPAGSTRCVRVGHAVKMYAARPGSVTETTHAVAASPHVR